MSLASAVAKGHPFEDILTADVLVHILYASTSFEVFSALVPRDMNMVFVNPDFYDHDAELLEEHYKLRHPFSPMSVELLKTFRNGLVRSTAATKLRFVPTNLDLVEKGTSSGPEVLTKMGRVEAWWQGLQEMRMPKGDVHMKLGFPACMLGHLTDSVMAAIHTRLLSRVLVAPTDELQLCGFSYSVDALLDGLLCRFQWVWQASEGSTAHRRPSNSQPRVHERYAVPARHDGAGHWHIFSRRVGQVLSFLCEFSFNWLAPAAF